MNGKGFNRLRVTAVSAATAIASLFGAVTRSARASTQLPLAYTSATRWRVQSSDCAATLGVAGNVCGIGVRQFTQPQETSPTTIAPPPTTPTIFTPPSTTTTPPTSPPTSGPTTIGGPTTTIGGPTTSPPTDTGGGSTTDAAHEPTALPPHAKPKSEYSNAIVAFNRSLGLAVNSTVFRAPNGKVDLSGKIVTAGPQKIAGLDTNVQYQFDGPSRSTRAIFTFHNGTNAPISTTLNTNIGGFGGSSAIKIGSSGIAALTAENRWFETAGGGDGKHPGGPPVVFVLYGSQARPMLRSLSTVALNGGAADFVASYEIKVAATDTVAIMVFAQVNNSVLPKDSIDSVFANLKTLDVTKLLNHLPLPKEKILNWNGPVRPRYSVGQRKL